MGSWKMAGWNVPDSVPSTLKGNGTHELLRKIFVEMYGRLSKAKIIQSLYQVGIHLTPDQIEEIPDLQTEMLTKFKEEMGWVEGILQENEWLKKIGTIMPNHLFVRPKGVL